MIKVLYTGSFDPITKGHMNIVSQASQLFDGVVIAVLQNKNKRQGFFEIDERCNIIKELYKNSSNIEVIKGKSNDLAFQLALDNDCKMILRGLRGLSDYDDEVQNRQANIEISNGSVNTVFLMADIEYQFISSSKVRDIFSYGLDISRYVDELVEEKMKQKRLERRINYGIKSIR